MVPRRPPRPLPYAFANGIFLTPMPMQMHTAPRCHLHAYAYACDAASFRMTVVVDKESMFEVDAGSF